MRKEGFPSFLKMPFSCFQRLDASGDRVFNFLLNARANGRGIDGFVINDVHRGAADHVGQGVPVVVLEDLDVSERPACARKVCLHALNSSISVTDL